MQVLLDTRRGKAEDGIRFKCPKKNYKTYSYLLDDCQECLDKKRCISFYAYHNFKKGIIQHGDERTV